MKINKWIFSFAVAFCAFLMPSTAYAKEEYINTDTLMEYTKEIGEIYDIDPYLLYAMCETESSRNIYAENGSCKGLMQVSTLWHADRMEKLNVENIYDPYGNILVAADFLSELYKLNSDTYYVLMRYNMKTSTANELYEKGEISYYAKSIVRRAEELKEMDNTEEKLVALNEQKLSEVKECIFPKGGVSAWL